MEQLNFFGEAGRSAGLPTDLLRYRPQIFSPEESRAYLMKFILTVPWEQRVVSMYGNPVLTPRLTAWFGDTDKNYAYSGNHFSPLPWTQDLQEIKERIELLAGTHFNSVLLNYYRDGNDSVAWHSDNERELGKLPLIASVSFGQVRRFDIRRKQDHTEKYSIKLEEGSVLIMKGDLQQHWEHRIAKSKTQTNARVNLTFRVIG